MEVGNGWRRGRREGRGGEGTGEEERKEWRRGRRKGRVEEGHKEWKGWRRGRRRNMCLDCTVLLLSWVFAVFHSQ